LLGEIMFGMEELLKTASDHKHKDSKGEMTGASKHDEGKEENAHTHSLKGGGETDKRENSEGHKHKEPNGRETEGPIKTAFKKGFQKEALSALEAAIGTGLLGTAAYGLKSDRDKYKKQKKLEAFAKSKGYKG
jgi:hypothetical protein